ncbi:hypothetical protein [Azorhizobium oxalatiphilum]|uniref:hypothetical protein n=1 Tax=Azorhizobium oxalatiphilum TaxID=980631 RepID=UPI001667D51B|nr:hypothetical protein [Azorhizobium oxalatiphilum]
MTVLFALALAAPAMAQQQQYAGREQDSLRRCFDDGVRKLTEQKVPMEDYAVVAVGLCDAPIRLYRDFVVSFETRRGNSHQVALARAESALSTEFRRARDAFAAYNRKNSERRDPTPGEAEV